jgi:integrase
VPREVHRLSAKAVEKASKPGYWCDGGGLYLQVSPTLSRSWIFRYSRNGHSREMGLGSQRDVTLADARGRAAECRRLLGSGADPIAVRNDKRTKERIDAAGTITFSKCADQYISAHKAGWSNSKHAEQWASTVKTYAGPVIGDLAVRDVDTSLLLRVLQPIWAQKAETASRLRGRLERILDWARVMGYRAGENPARWRGHMDKLLASALNRKGRKHHAALPYDQLSSFIQGLRGQEADAARALEFLILTTARTGEVIGARPDEINVAKAVWTVPAHRMKKGKEHRVPLSPRAIEIIRDRLSGPFLFNGREEGKPLSNMAMLELLRRMDREDLTVHGFRSTFRDWAAECTTFPSEVCEMALAHAIGDKVEAAYRRGDLFEKRRNLMLEWAIYCDAAKRRAKVIRLRRRRG